MAALVLLAMESIPCSLEETPRRSPSSVNPICFKSLATLSRVSCTRSMQARLPTLKSQFWGVQLHLKDDESCSGPHIEVQVQVQARLFEPAIFEASKLKVLYLGERIEETRPDEQPRAYTLTHSDITAKLTLAVSQTINEAQLQGWYNRLQRDEVLAEWRKSQGRMSLHVHCHISGGNWLLDFIPHLRFYIFRKELPVVFEAFRYGDVTLFRNHPELEEALVWVYFHSNVKEYNRVECWGPLRQAAKGCVSKDARKAIHNAVDKMKESMRPTAIMNLESGFVLVSSNNGDWKMPVRCPHPCECCFPASSVIPLPPHNWHHSTSCDGQ